MRAKAEERANPDIFTPKGKTGVGGLKRKRPDLGSGKENVPQKVTYHLQKLLSMLERSNVRKKLLGSIVEQIFSFSLPNLQRQTTVR